MRAADDFTVIRVRMEEIRRERRGWCEPERRTSPNAPGSKSRCSTCIRGRMLASAQAV
jgi:hypothetical protein